jgi:hypothetical protein
MKGFDPNKLRQESLNQGDQDPKPSEGSRRNFLSSIFSGFSTVSAAGLFMLIKQCSRDSDRKSQGYPNR